MSNLETILDHLGIEHFPSNSENLKIRCLNPSHNDHHPSMNVGKNFPHPIYCYTCGFKGSLFKQCEEIFGIPFSKISKDLGLKKDSDKPYVKKTYSRKIKKEIDIKATLIPVFQNKAAMEYVKSRRISDDFIRFFDCFYMQEGTIFANKEKSDWYKRLCIPIYDEKKELVSIEGRDITRQSKVKVLYPKGTGQNMRSHLFNWDNIDKERPVFICEGIMGLSTVWQIDRNVISTYGKELTDEQKEKIKQLKKIVVVPDNDWDKGRDNLLDTMNKFDEFYKERDYELIVIEDIGKDPNDYTVKQFQQIMTENRISISKLWIKYKGIGELA